MVATDTPAWPRFAFTHSEVFTHRLEHMGGRLHMLGHWSCLAGLANSGVALTSGLATCTGL